MIILAILILPYGFGLIYINDVSPSYINLDKGELKEIDVYVKNGEAGGIELTVELDNPSSELQIVGKDSHVLVLAGGEEKAASFRFYGVEWAEVPILVDIRLEFNNSVLDTYSYLVNIKQNESEIVTNDTFAELLIKLNETDSKLSNLTALVAVQNASIMELMNHKNTLFDTTSNLTALVADLKIVAREPEQFNWAVPIYILIAVIGTGIIVLILNKLKFFETMRRTQAPLETQTRRRTLNDQSDAINNMMSERDKQFQK